MYYSLQYLFSVLTIYIYTCIAPRVPRSFDEGITNHREKRAESSTEETLVDEVDTVHCRLMNAITAGRERERGISDHLFRRRLNVVRFDFAFRDDEFFFGSQSGSIQSGSFE